MQPLGVPTFANTRVPKRVVLYYAQASSFEDLMPCLQASAQSWYDAKDPSLRVWLYNDVSARAFLDAHFPPSVRQAYDSLVPAAYRADLFRLCELLKYGGVWADVKLTRVADYEHLVSRDGTLVLERIDIGAWNGFFAAPPGAPWLLGALKSCLDNVRTRSYATSHLDVTGPGCLGRGVRAFLGMSTDSFSLEFLKACEANNRPSALSSTRLLRLQDDFVVDFDQTIPLIRELNPEYRALKPKTPEGDYCLAWMTRAVYT